jgi:ribonuclease D
MDDNDSYTTVKEWMKLNGQALAILQALAAWRERTARTEDLPRRQVMPDTGLIGLARAKPRKRDDLKGIRYAPQGAVFRYADEILGVIAAACQIPQSEWPRKVHSPRPDIPTGFVEILQALVRTTAEEEGIASTLLATTADLNTIVTNRRRLDEVEVEVLKGWRNELVGRKLVALLNGELKLRIVDGERIVFE